MLGKLSKTTVIFEWILNSRKRPTSGWWPLMLSEMMEGGLSVPIPFHDLRYSTCIPWCCEGRFCSRNMHQRLQTANRNYRDYMHTHARSWMQEPIWTSWHYMVLEIFIDIFGTHGTISTEARVRQFVRQQQGVELDRGDVGWGMKSH